MPTARGTMQMGRINVFPTTTTLVSINPSEIGFCGDNITFTVTVVNNRGVGFPTPTGTVLIKDRITDTILDSGSLSSGTVVITTNAITISNNQIYAQYVGIVNQFGVSESSPDVPYSVSLIGTTTSITNTSGEDFCFHNNYNLNVHVQRTVGGAAVTSGSVQVNLYSDSVSFVTIGTATLNGSGNATVVLPADSTVPGNNYYVQARYLGAACLGASASPIGTNGTLVHSVSITQNTTTITAGVAGSTTFCINSSKTFNANIGSAFLGGPSVGSVTWTAVKSPTTLILGTDSSISNGIASIVVPSATFPSTGAWTITAAYTGDGYCFANSISTGISVTPTTFEVLINRSFPLNVTYSFCRATPQFFIYFVTSDFIGTINGTFVLKSSFGTTLGTIVTSGPSIGFSIQFSLAANTVLTGSQDLFVQFTPISGSCYGAETSNNYDVTVTSSSTQFPASTSLAISPASGSSFTTFMFTITIQKGGGSGPLDGAGSLNGSASLYRFDNLTLSFHLINNNISIFDNGTFGSGSYSTSGLPSSTTFVKAVWNGNSCYGFQESSLEAISVFNPPH